MHKFKIKIYLNFIFLICLTSIISAYFIEYVLGHQPCNLCLIERIPYGLGLILIILNYTLVKDERFIILLFVKFGKIEEPIADNSPKKPSENWLSNSKIVLVSL